MLIKLCKIGEVHFGLFYSNAFHVKAKNERFTAAESRCHQNLKFEHFKSSGSLRSYDGNCKENVSLKLNFALS